MDQFLYFILVNQFPEYRRHTYSLSFSKSISNPIPMLLSHPDIIVNFFRPIDFDSNLDLIHSRFSQSKQAEKQMIPPF